MNIVLVILSFLVPIVMYILFTKWNRFAFIFNGLAIVSILIFGNIASLSIYDIIKHHQVFMTKIHGIFLNPFFLLTGAYLGVYMIYRLIILLVKEPTRPL